MSIKKLRLSKKLTQLQVANMLGVSRTTVTMWETGKAAPATNKLVQLAEIFDCTVDELLK